MVVIPEKPTEKKIPQNIRLRADLIERITGIAKQLNVSKTHVIESLLEYGIDAHEKEQKKKGKR